MPAYWPRAARATGQDPRAGRLDGRHPIEDQSPVIVFQHEPSLPAPSCHLHTPSNSRSVATRLRTRPATRGQLSGDADTTSGNRPSNAHGTMCDCSHLCLRVRHDWGDMTNLTRSDSRQGPKGAQSRRLPLDHDFAPLGSSPTCSNSASWTSPKSPILRWLT